jgi:RND family efflux transporter MFP subunit
MSRSNEARELGPGTPGAHDGADLGFQLPEPAKISGARAAVLVGVGLVVVSSAFVIGWLPKRLARRETEASVESVGAVVPRVEVVSPKALSSDRALVLPGTVTALEEASIRTRANGYVRRRLVDIGDKVEAGALLLEVDTPDLEQQLEQARAQLAQASAALTLAKANKDYAETTLSRREKLAPAGVTSAEELDKSRAEASVAAASVSVAQASLEAQSANVRRLTQERSFARVTAPFAGTITTRSVDKGSLVSPSAELFTLASTDPIRVVIEVPQDVAPSVKLDVPAKVTIREFPGRAFEGKVARFASALDARSRTMTTIIHVPNPKGELLGGMYAQAELSLPLPHRVLEVPSTALLNDAHGTRVAVVGPDKRVHLAPIVIERDTGPTLHLASGVDEHDRVVRIGSAALTEGRPVEIAEAKGPLTK